MKQSLTTISKLARERTNLTRTQTRIEKRLIKGDKQYQKGMFILKKCNEYTRKKSFQSHLTPEDILALRKYNFKKHAQGIKTGKCGKKCFDEIGAQLVLAKAKNSLQANRKEERMYFCDRCKAWHLTSIK